jgi:hypothetical protein
MATIADLRGSLDRQLDNPAKLGAVSTRVLLRTGVNLRTPSPAQNSDQDIVAKVRKALADMGYQT